jgi:hypothetical protein
MKISRILRTGAAASVLFALATFGILPPNIHAAQQQEIPVVVTLADPGDLPGVRISSDELGSYSKADARLKAFLGLDGQLRFLTWDSPDRTISVDFPDDGLLPFSGAQFVHGNMVTLGEDTDEDGKLTAKQLDPGAQGERLNLLNIAVGGTRRAGLHLRFPVGSFKSAKTWQIRWGGGETVPGAAAGLVTVERLSATAWMIFAGDTDLAAIGIANSAPVAVYPMPFCLLVETAN